jgi:hypothetical protein
VEGRCCVGRGGENESPPVALVFFAGLSAVLSGFAAVQGGFVVFALVGDAFVEAGYFGVDSCEVGHGDAGGGGGVGVFLVDLGDGGIGDDAVEGVEAAEDPGFLGDAEGEEFFLWSGGRVGAELVLEEALEGFAGFVLVEEGGRKEGIGEDGFGLAGFFGKGLAFTSLPRRSAQDARIHRMKPPNEPCMAAVRLLSEDLFVYLAVDVGQAEVPSLVFVGEFQVVHP